MSAYGQVGRGDRYSGAPWATRSPVIGQHGMAATEQPLASLAAIEILKKGGSAMDAAIAANACIGLMQPVLNGIGGDLFAIVWDPEDKASSTAITARAAQPMGRDLARMKAEVDAACKKAGMRQTAHIPSVGSLPVTVPGAVDAWFALHGKFGKLPMTDDLAPAIGYASNGFPSDPAHRTLLEREHGRVREEQGFDRRAQQRARTPISSPDADTRPRKAKFSETPTSPTP